MCPNFKDNIINYGVLWGIIYYSISINFVNNIFVNFFSRFQWLAHRFIIPSKIIWITFRSSCCETETRSYAGKKTNCDN